eukprot:SAG11_NODE_505_length_8888_cov_12.479235_6_plen_85_part_00
MNVLVAAQGVTEMMACFDGSVPSHAELTAAMRPYLLLSSWSDSHDGSRSNDAQKENSIPVTPVAADTPALTVLSTPPAAASVGA